MAPPLTAWILYFINSFIFIYAMYKITKYLGKVNTVQRVWNDGVKKQSFRKEIVYKFKEFDEAVNRDYKKIMEVRNEQSK